MLSAKQALMFKARIEVTDRDANSCWNWIGSIDQDGYGIFCRGRTNTRAHRTSYEIFVGKIPDGLVIDHLCLNKICVNPLHLEPVTIRENTRRFYRIFTHCPNGHEYTADNLLIRSSTPDIRVCRTCDRLRVKAYRLRKLQGVFA